MSCGQRGVISHRSNSKFSHLIESSLFAAALCSNCFTLCCAPLCAPRDSLTSARRSPPQANETMAWRGVAWRGLEPTYSTVQYSTCHASAHKSRSPHSTRCGSVLLHVRVASGTTLVVNGTRSEAPISEQTETGTNRAPRAPHRDATQTGAQWGGSRAGERLEEKSREWPPVR